MILVLLLEPNFGAGSHNPVNNKCNGIPIKWLLFDCEGSSLDPPAWKKLDSLRVLPQTLVTLKIYVYYECCIEV
jgi:hypothetical protein